MKLSWLWPVIILLSGIATVLVTRLLPDQSVTMLVTMWFLFVCPGMAYLRFFRLGTLIVEITIAVALSLSIDAIVTGIFLYAHAWHPTYTLLSLVALSCAGAVGQLIFMREPAMQVPPTSLNIKGEGKLDEAATVSVPATNIAAIIRDESRRAGVMAGANEMGTMNEARTISDIPMPQHAGIEDISTRMLPATVSKTPDLVEELPTNMFPSIPQGWKAEELPTNMLPVAPINTAHNNVENIPTSMLPSVPATPRLNEDLPTNMFPIPSTDELARRGQQNNQQGQDSSRQSRKKKSGDSRKPASFRSPEKPLEDRPTITSMKER